MAAEANETYRQLGLNHWIATVDRARAEDAVFGRECEVWVVGYQASEVRIRDIKGMAVLGRLLAEPGPQVASSTFSTSPRHRAPRIAPRRPTIPAR